MAVVRFVDNSSSTHSSSSSTYSSSGTCVHWFSSTYNCELCQISKHQPVAVLITEAVLAVAVLTLVVAVVLMVIDSSGTPSTTVL